MASSQQRSPTWRRVAGLCFLLALSPMAISAAAANYNPYQYDLTAPMFTPDGRLLQVEYARLAASEHSSPLFLMPLRVRNQDGTESEEDDETKDDTSQRTQRLWALVAFRPANRLQERLLVYPDDNINAQGGAGVVLGLSGILADCGAWNRQLQHALVQRSQQIGRGGHNNAALWARLARTIGHTRARGGGIRPFGASLLVMDPCEYFLVDPSGALARHSLNNVDTPIRLVGGGEGETGRRLEQELKRTWAEVCDSTTTLSPADQLAQVLAKIQAVAVSSNESSKNDEDRTEESKDELALEVVLISSQQGIFKLTPAQLLAIQARQPNAKLQ